MIKVLVKLFLKEQPNRENKESFVRYTVFAGILGVVCNLFLFALKITTGFLMSSIAIISDAFNNLSDSGTSVVSIVGAKLSAQKPDKEHPFGHGRYEYIFSLVVSFIIILVGFELLKSSVQKIIHPQEIRLATVPMILLCISVPVKLWMYSYNKYLGNLTGSSMLAAASRDSINDAISTSAVILCAIVGKWVKFPPLDGIVGTVVSVIIMYSGFKITLDTIGVLLGAAPDKETVNSIKEYILSAPGVVGVHDLMVHDYGPGRVIASVHAEVPDDCNVVEIHETIDDLEQKIERELGIHIVVHMDPISVNCDYTGQMREMVMEVVRSVDQRLNIHDFRMTDGENNLNLIFDVEVPLDMKNSEGIDKVIAEKLKERDSRYSAVINVDYVYD